MRLIKIFALMVVILLGSVLAIQVLPRQSDGGAAQIQNAVDGALQRLSGQSDGADPKVQNAVDGVLQAFESYSIVAIGEAHGVEQIGEFYQALLRHPDFAKKVNAIVMEFGNARYQELVDAYLRGEDVPYAELAKVWSDMVGKNPGGTEVMYPQLFAAVRALNQTLPDNQKIRILLGDPPIDWSTVQSSEDVKPFQGQRATHFAKVVTEQVLDKGLKALVIVGASHLDRGSSANAPAAGGEQSNQLQSAPGVPSGSTPQGQPQMRQMPQTNGNTARLMQQIVDAKYPGRTFVILVHTGFADDECNARAEARMKSWQTPALALVKGSWLETIECQKFPAMVLKQRANSQADTASSGESSQQKPSAQAQPQMQALPAEATQSSPLRSADGYLYLGPRDSLTMSPIDPMTYLDMEFFKEQSRRHEIMTGKPLNWAEVARGNPQRFVDKFAR